jgi:hypothetical protein
MRVDGDPSPFSETEIGFADRAGLTDPCTIECHSGYLRPRWIPGTDLAAFIGSDRSSVWIETGLQGTGPLEKWAQTSEGGQERFVSFDPGPNNRTLAETVTAGAPPGSASKLVLLKTAPPNALPDPPEPASICATADFSRTVAAPRWSPDGSMIAWEGANGVFVSPAPTPNANGTCILGPRLIAPGGTEPSWGPANAPISTPPAPASPPSLKKALKKGLTVQIACPSACHVKVTARAGKKIVGRGSGSLRAAGVLQVRVQFKKRIRKKLQKRKKLKLLLEAKITYDAGGTSIQRSKVTLNK